MKRFAWGCVIILGLSWKVAAQAPIGPPPTAVPLDPAAATAAKPATIWSKLGISCDQLRECRRRCCKTELGKLINNMFAPARLASGGLVPDCCPAVLTAEELAKLAPGEVSPAEAAAAKIKADEATAKARRAAVKYLGTVDCHYFPEAEAALIAALRADRNECVRLEAAYVLGRGCCCTKRTIEALNIVITGSDRDGNPSETSERVRICAMESIQNCMSRGVEFPTPEPPELPRALPPEIPTGLSMTQPGQIQLAAHAEPVLGRPVPISALEEARRTIAEKTGAAAPRPLTTGSRSLFQIFSFSTHGVSAQNAAPPQSAEPAPLATLAPPTAPAPRRVPLQPIGLAPIQILP